MKLRIGHIPRGARAVRVRVMMPIRMIGTLTIAALLVAPQARAADTTASSAPAGAIIAPVVHSDALPMAPRMQLASYDDWQHAGDIPANLLRMSPDQRFAIVVDASLPRLYVFRNVDGEPRYVADYYVTIGRDGAGKVREGDHRTPLGVYFVTTHIPRAKLAAFYGPAAYPLDYPNAWDRRLGHTGYGIWVHGTPDTVRERPPRASRGCIVLPNSDLAAIEPYLQPGDTRVIIADGVHWEKRTAVRALNAQIEQAIDSWRRDWESRDAKRYFAHYAADFRIGPEDLNTWITRRSRAIDGQTRISVALTDLSLYLYPGNEPLAVATFNQHYEDGDHSDTTRRQQYWKLENGEWKIVYEGPVS
ncbi:MAG TPA: L,D-transpeptidase family protein [Burkholderiales bacterium]|nr:L,D-transpeptidase family protein [Burkholderiales bacterium]